MIEVNYNDGTEFFDTDAENAKLCWNSFKDPNRENFQIITAHSNNFGQFFEDSLNPSEINFSTKTVHNFLFSGACSSSTKLQFPISLSSILPWLPDEPPPLPPPF